MSVDTLDGAGHGGGPDGASGPVDLRRPYRRPVPDSSVSSVHRVARLDARTHIVAARRPGGTWYRLRSRTRFTRQNAAALRAAGISEVILRRGLRRTSFPLGWLAQRES